MGPLPSVPGVVRVALRFTDAEDTDITAALHWHYTGGVPSAIDCAAFGADFISDYTTNLAPLAVAGVTLTQCRVTDLSSPTGADQEVAASVAGSGGPNFLPAGCCLLTNYHIGRRYRGGKPRTYWPFGHQDKLQDAQTWQSGFLATAQSAFDSFFLAALAFSSSGVSLDYHANVSYFSGSHVVTNPDTGRARNVNNKRVTPLVDLISSQSVNPRVAYQRRRSVR